MPCMTISIIYYIVAQIIHARMKEAVCPCKSIYYLLHFHSGYAEAARSIPAPASKSTRPSTQQNHANIYISFYLGTQYRYIT